FEMTEKDANILVVGNHETDIFPKELLPFANKRIKFGKGKININFLINYNWKQDIGKEMLSKEISRLDLIIRWGGQKRLSGFLPIQSVYSDFYFVDNYWPNFKEQDFLDALMWYQNCDVTLGG
ncbi:MAG: undecaprenyl diphosphate synthase family protein, partial [Defluviitaleaceae bacterium]|nr:undecaprenyl diphosphate synthase family protein [Defluviitaleaceae bacterium]